MIAIRILGVAELQIGARVRLRESSTPSLRLRIKEYPLYNE